MRAACQGTLPVDVRVLVEGEEETTGAGAIDWVRADMERADAAIVFDAGMADERTPAITVGLRGLITAAVDVVTAGHDLHSGVYGGPALNALHALRQMLTVVAPRADGTLVDALAAGIQPPSEVERGAWALLPPGAQMLADAGALPADAQAAEEFYARTWALPTVEVNEIRGGDARTIVPARAHATLSMRLAPGQDGRAISCALMRLLREAAPTGAAVDVTCETADPVLFATDEPVIALAARALEHACGTPPALVRSGGSVAVVTELASRRVPTVVTGFCVPADAIHGPDESFRLEALRWGETAARELLLALADLRR